MRLVVSLLLLGYGWTAAAQTTCAIQHTGIGVFICYPNPSENRADSRIPDSFHLSAQANAADGKEIAGYKVLIDNRLVYESKLPAPIRNLSVETNLDSPFDTGFHALRLEVNGAGSAEVEQLQVYPSPKVTFCDPFNRVDPRACQVSNAKARLRWLPAEAAPEASKTNAFEAYSAYLKLYGQNLKSLEADVADAVAVDTQGNLYVASHAFTDVDLRKYAPNGSLIYASLIRSCGEGFLSVAGLAVDNAGRVWIAGDTTACLPATAHALRSQAGKIARPRGFVMLVDTAQSGSGEPLYVTYLSDVESHIAAIRVDAEGNAYLAGTTASPEFPHDVSLNVGESPAPAQTQDKKIGFVSVLNPSGSGLLWSTVLPDARLTALALDAARNVFVTGRVPSRRHVLVAELSGRGSRLSYLARFGGSADEEGRAIAIAGQAWIFVAGSTDSRDFPASSLARSSPHEDLRSFVLALKPCKTGALHARLLAEADMDDVPEVALTPALDAFTASSSAAPGTPDPGATGRKSWASLQVAAACPAGAP